MRMFTWKGHESDTFAGPSGSLRAVEVASFPSGHSVLRWFYPLGDHLHFDLLLHPEQEDMELAGDAAHMELELNGSSVRLATPPDFFVGLSPLELGEVRWFVEHLGGRFLVKDWDQAGGPSFVRQRLRVIRAIKSARKVAGTITIDRDELEVFELLGEPSPLLWSDARFREWAEERRST